MWNKILKSPFREENQEVLNIRRMKMRRDNRRIKPEEKEKEKKREDVWSLRKLLEETEGGLAVTTNLCQLLAHKANDLESLYPQRISESKWVYMLDTQTWLGRGI